MELNFRCPEGDQPSHRQIVPAVHNLDQHDSRSHPDFHLTVVRDSQHLARDVNFRACFSNS